MGYDKKEIDKAFLSYARRKSEKVLGRLLMSCGPMIDVVLSRYASDFHPYLEDLHQDIQIKLIRSLRLNRILINYKQSPSSYLFFKIRLFARVAASQCRRTFDMGRPLTKMEETVLQMMDESDDKLTITQTAKRLGLPSKRVKAQYNSALKKRNIIRMGSSIIQGSVRHPLSHVSVEILDERTADATNLDPMKQLLAKEILEETLKECLDMIDNHPVYRGDAEQIAAIKARVRVLFLQEFGEGVRL